MVVYGNGAPMLDERVVTEDCREILGKKDEEFVACILLMISRDNRQALRPGVDSESSPNLFDSEDDEDSLPQDIEDSSDFEDDSEAEATHRDYKLKRKIMQLEMLPRRKSLRARDEKTNMRDEGLMEIQEEEYPSTEVSQYRIERNQDSPIKRGRGRPPSLKKKVASPPPVEKGRRWIRFACEKHRKEHARCPDNCVFRKEEDIEADQRS
eukprot:TRINITY_DN2110_c0_g1_i1.p1 TRINITY_DN2110_c0_g1~~TRINITY_DN2110_c0_g1_i1.p1  ORF type:complete len:210 (+),score=40.63 TRINITY_DN2110_c0_g1_i1:197-826(+)